MKTRFFLALVFFTMLLAGCITTDYPKPNGNSVVENAWEYCAQFSQPECDSKFYAPTAEDNFSQNVTCIWNNETNACGAQIGYV